MGSEKLITYNLLVIGHWKYEKGTRVGSLSKYINSVHFCGCDLFHPDSIHYRAAMTAIPHPRHCCGCPPPPHSHPHPHFLLASAGFCRWCVREGMWDAGWGTVLFLIYCYRTPVEAAPMCRLLSGGNYFWRWGPPRPPNVAWLSIAQLFKQAIHGTHSFTSFIYQIRRRMICKWASFHGTMGGENMWQGGSIWIQITIQGTHYMINGRSVVKMLRFSVWASWFLETLFSYGGTL